MSCDGKSCFQSVCVLEDALIEHRALVQSYSDVCDEIPAWLATLQRSLDRLDRAFRIHQDEMHSRLSK